MHRWVNINIDVFMEKILKENQDFFLLWKPWSYGPGYPYLSGQL